MGRAEGPLAPCPNCRQPAALNSANAFRPFCSERCQQIDFGSWIDERHVIVEPIPADRPPDDDSLA